MSKPKAPPRQAENEARAVLRTLRVSPQKLNLVAQSIRGLAVEKALNELEFSRKRIAADVRKCLQSAIANAENNHNLDIDSLVVAQAHVGKNLVMKRSHARARGRGARVEKIFSQITIVVRAVEEADEGGQRRHVSPERRKPEAQGAAA
ncbi:MAG: 50S ribosomal protein L22 [Hyphomonadaceae bacterium]